jgi:hypothetical protein
MTMRRHRPIPAAVVTPTTSGLTETDEDLLFEVVPPYEPVPVAHPTASVAASEPVSPGSGSRRQPTSPSAMPGGWSAALTA